MGRNYMLHSFFFIIYKKTTVESEGKCRKHSHLLLIAQFKNPVKNLLNENQLEGGVNMRVSFLF